MNARILAALVGVAPNRRADFHTALQARPIVPMVLMLIAIRFRRLFDKLTCLLPRKPAQQISQTKAGSDTDVTGTMQAPASSPEEATLAQRTDASAFPRLIFQTWKSKVDMPTNYARWSQSFRRLNPGFAYCLWDDFDNRRFIATHYPWFLPVYDTYPREIYRADAVRYFFLYQFGGLYADMDTECLKPLAPLFQSGDVWLGRMGKDPAFPHSIPNAIMASRPLQEFWLVAMHLLVEKAKTLADPAAMVGKGPEALTGPILLKNAYDIYTTSAPSALRSLIQGIAARLPDHLQPRTRPSQVKLLAPEVWYPIDWSNMIHLRLSSEVVDFHMELGERTKHWLFPRSYLVTYWSHSWKQQSKSQHAAA